MALRKQQQPVEQALFLLPSDQLTLRQRPQQRQRIGIKTSDFNIEVHTVPSAAAFNP